MFSHYPAYLFSLNVKHWLKLFLQYLDFVHLDDDVARITSIRLNAPRIYSKEIP